MELGTQAEDLGQAFAPFSALSVEPLNGTRSHRLADPESALSVLSLLSR